MKIYIDIYFVDKELTFTYPSNAPIPRVGEIVDFRIDKGWLKGEVLSVKYSIADIDHCTIKIDVKKIY